MKSCVIAGVLFSLVGTTGGVAAEEAFTRMIAPSDYAAAGLEKLTADERARLDALVRDYKSGAIQAARAEAQEKIAAAEAKAAADIEAAKAEAAKERERDGGLLSRAKVLLKPGTQIEYSTIESQIAGDFTGWKDRATFVLENGQRWIVANPGSSYYCSPVKNPKVTVSPARTGGYWLEFPDLGKRVRVLPVEGR